MLDDKQTDGYATTESERNVGMFAENAIFHPLFICTITQNPFEFLSKISTQAVLVPRRCNKKLISK